MHVIQQLPKALTWKLNKNRSSQKRQGTSSCGEQYFHLEAALREEEAIMHEEGIGPIRVHNGLAPLMRVHRDVLRQAVLCQRVSCMGGIGLQRLRVAV